MRALLGWWRRLCRASASVLVLVAARPSEGVQSYEGLVLHERPDLYQADGVTLRPGAGKIPLRLITNRPEMGSVGDAMGRIVPIFRLALQAINNSSSLLPDHVIELHLSDSRCSTRVAVRSSLRMIYSNPPGYFHAQFGPLCTDPTGAVNSMIQIFGLFQLATISRGAALSDGNRYPYLCRTSSSLQFVADGISKLLQVLGWTKVASVKDTKGLSMSTVRDFKVAVRTAVGEGYPFDEDYISMHSYSIDERNFFSADVVRALQKGDVRVFIVAVYEDVGARLYCEMFRNHFYGKHVQSILALSWWGDTWIAEQVKEQGVSLPCTADEIFWAAEGMLSFGQTAFLASSSRHEITGAVLNDIRNAYISACSAPGAEGCHVDFASYDYDGLAIMAKAFHVWLYEQGHNLTDFDYDNPDPQRELYEIVKGMTFTGVTGSVAFFNETNLDCERKGFFSLRQLRFLAQVGGDTGWAEITSFTNQDGFATKTAWAPIIWQDGSLSYLGSGQGWRPVARGRPASFGGDASGLDLVPMDRIECRDGQTSSGMTCMECPEGTRGERGTCIPCDVGKYSPARGLPFCTECPRGTFQNATGSSFCNNCTAGSRSLPGTRSSCVSCPVGRHQPLDGQAECPHCGIGKYQASSGRAECEPCPSSRTTALFGATLPADCVCAAGSFEPYPALAGEPLECQPCRDGMICAEGSRLRSWLNHTSGARVYPVLKPKFYSSAQDPVSVYSCLDKTSCPGGDPGTCDAHRQGVVCARCELGYYSFGNRCHECISVDLSGATIVVAAFFVGPLAVVFAYTRLQEPLHIRNMDSAKNRTLTILFFYLAFFQMLCFLGEFYLALPEAISSPSTALADIASVTRLLRMDCVGNGQFNTFVVGFIARSALPLIVASYFVLDYFLFRYVIKHICKCCAQRKDSILVRGMDRDLLINAFGTLMYSFSIVVFGIAFDLFKCYPHPNGLSSLQVSPDVICYSGVWSSMLVVGIMAILLYFVGAFALFSFILYITPSKVEDAGFKRRWKFLLVKWRPNRFWFGQAFILKGALLNLAIVVFQDGSQQVIYTGLVQLLYLFCVIVFWPWRHVDCNFLDAMVTTMIMLIAFLCLHFAEKTVAADRFMGHALITATILAPIIISLQLLKNLAVAIRMPRSEIIDSIRAAIETERTVERLSHAGTRDILMAITAITSSDRIALLRSLQQLDAELVACARQSSAGDMVHFRSLGGFQVASEARVSSRFQSGFSDLRTFSPDHESMLQTAVKTWCETSGDADHVVAKIYGNQTDLPAASLRTSVGGSAGEYVAELLDVYREGSVSREALLVWMQAMQKRPLEMRRSCAVGACESDSSKTSLACQNHDNGDLPAQPGEHGNGRSHMVLF